MGEERISGACELRRILQRTKEKKKKEKKKLRIYLLQRQQDTKKRIASIGNNMNSPIRTSAIGLLQHLQLLYLPSELDIDEQIQQVTLYFYCMQYQYHPVIPTSGAAINFWLSLGEESDWGQVDF
jgi:hypothetical protein